jgi:hypothetical protein
MGPIQDRNKREGPPPPLPRRLAGIRLSIPRARRRNTGSGHRAAAATALLRRVDARYDPGRPARDMQL